jgi:phosphoribosylformylglycinamidine synthase PurS subunit
MFKAVIYVTLKESVLDPQGVAVQGSLHTLGFSNVRDVRIGKRLEMIVEGESKQQAEEQVKVMCEKLLANPVIENYTYQIEEVA